MNPSTDKRLPDLLIIAGGFGIGAGAALVWSPAVAILVLGCICLVLGIAGAMLS